MCNAFPTSIATRNKATDQTVNRFRSLSAATCSCTTARGADRMKTLRTVVITSRSVACPTTGTQPGRLKGESTSPIAPSVAALAGRGTRGSRRSRSVSRVRVGRRHASYAR